VAPEDEYVDGRDYRAIVLAANDGGVSPEEIQTSNVVTYTLANPINLTKPTLSINGKWSVGEWFDPGPYSVSIIKNGEEIDTSTDLTGVINFQGNGGYYIKVTNVSVEVFSNQINYTELAWPTGNYVEKNQEFVLMDNMVVAQSKDEYIKDVHGVSLKDFIIGTELQKVDKSNLIKYKNKYKKVRPTG
jgi:hypothetical protein